jgi:predicted anti-sigma-YlaC factor YlaD
VDLQTLKTEQICPRDAISSYLDGELSSHNELVLEKHLANCKNCLNELNEQKKMLSALDFTFNEKNNQPEIELPKNFAKVIAVRAESGVSGLRRPEERSRAFLLCAGLFLLILIGLGTETNGFSSFTNFSEQIMALGGFIFRLGYDLAIGLCIISRALCQQFIISPIFEILLILCIFIFSFILLSRFVIRFNRTIKN